MIVLRISSRSATTSSSAERSLQYVLGRMPSKWALRKSVGAASPEYRADRIECISMRRLALLYCLFAVFALAILAAGPASSRQVTKADVDRWMKELSNWGRWGRGDQMGTVNLITPAKRKAAAALVQEGVPVSLAHDADTQKATDNSSPYVHRMTATGARPA